MKRSVSFWRTEKWGCWFTNYWSPNMEEQEETEERGRPFEISRCRFHRQGNLCKRLILGVHKMIRSLHSLAKISSLYRGLNQFRHIFNPHGLNNISLSQSYVLETVPYCFLEHTFQGKGPGWGPGSGLKSNSSYVLSMPSSNRSRRQGIFCLFVY